MHVKVLFLGPARDLAGLDETGLILEAGATLTAVREVIGSRFPRLAGGLSSMRLAVNYVFVSDATVLHDGDEMAVIPPVSGGMEDEPVWVEIVTGPIDAERVRTFIGGDAGLGGIVTFEGVTRAENDPAHGRLVRLEYEVYQDMALRQLERLATEARQRWSAGRVAIVHQVGPVVPGEASVIIAVACGHRKEAFEACRWLIDTLKTEVPIWKKDVFEDGFERWVDPTKGSIG